MIRHLVLLRFVPETTDEQVAALTAGLAELPGLIPSIRTYQYGRDLGLSDAGWHYGITATFDDEAGWRAYADHPEHLRLIADLIAPIRSDRAAVQFAIDTP